MVTEHPKDQDEEAVIDYNQDLLERIAKDEEELFEGLTENEKVKARQDYIKKWTTIHDTWKSKKQKALLAAAKEEAVFSEEQKKI